MYRCVLITALGLSCAVSAGAQALAQQPYLKREFPATALRGDIQFLNPPQIELNGKAAQLSPGSRIRGTHNMVVLSGTLTGQQTKVHYTLDDISQQVKDVWILRPEEVAVSPWPRTLLEAQTWRFDAMSQRWTKP